MRTLFVLGLAACLAGLGWAETSVGDDAELAPILNSSWVEGSCEAPTATLDWARDKDGSIYRRDGGLTPLDGVRFVDGRLVTDDSVGIGLTRSEYRLARDGTLRLMQETWYEEGDPNGTPTVQVKDGRRVAADGGMAEAAAQTPVLAACERRESLFSADIVSALDGRWVATGGSCADDKGTVAFDLVRAAPRVIRTVLGEMAGGEAFALEIRQDGADYVLTEGSAMEAMIYRLKPGANGSLTEVIEDQSDSESLLLSRCAR